jgi:DNA-binding NarL/FixJ family response regulator
MNGLEGAKVIAQVAPKVRLLMFTMHKSDELVRIAQAVGITEVLSKSTGVPGNLISAIELCVSRLPRTEQPLPLEVITQKPSK